MCAYPVPASSGRRSRACEAGGTWCSPACPRRRSPRWTRSRSRPRGTLPGFQHGVLVGSRIYLVVRDRLDGAAGVPLGGLAREGLRLVSNLGGAAQDYDEPGHEHH